ncbi:MAG: efflux RND transporter periplasmic adaptor subunit [Planctomycetia bacterium]|nr:efflux RND transporter periplasmic adaptor subunit [Planctomycetia bacterium]
MRIKTDLRLLCIVFCFSLFLFPGCDFWDRLFKKKVEISSKPTAIKVETMKPEKRIVIDYEEFTGETRAVENVNIQAQVSGILKNTLFTEGSEVRKDDVLFEIEPEIYQAILETATGNLQSAQGELAALRAREPQLRNEKERQITLIESKTVSESEYEIAVAAYNECLAKIQKGEADIIKARAELLEAEINLKYTKILSPIDGYISRRLVTEGNLIQPHSTSLAQIVSLDPIYVYFYVDETTYLKLVAINEKQIKGLKSKDEKLADLKIEFRLTNEESYTDKNNVPLHTGIVKYTDPSMDDSSGTVLLRATCPNPKPGNGMMNKIIPGMMVHVRIPVTENYSAILVPEEALGTEQGIRYIYVVDKEGKAQMRHLELGPLQPDNMRVVRKGVKPDDTIIVSGLLRLRPGSAVAPKETTLNDLRKGI